MAPRVPCSMADTSPRSATKKRSGLRIAAKLVGAVVAVWLAGDAVYSRVVAWQIAAWEETVTRDAGGVMAGCQAYTLSPVRGAGAAANPALLLVHGINASPRHYDKLAPRLAELGHHCRVMRLPGFAEPIKEYAAHDASDWIAAVDRELSALKEEHEVVGVVGHSLGGAVTIGQLLAEPDSADFAVLLAPAVAVSNQRSPVLSTRSWHEIGRWTLPSTRILSSPFEIDSHDPANAEFPGRCPFAPRAVVDELFLLMDRNRESAPAFLTPILMVVTEADQVVDWRAAQRFFDQAASTRKELLVLEDSGHEIPIDYGWESVAEAIHRFGAELGE